MSGPDPSPLGPAPDRPNRAAAERRLGELRHPARARAEGRRDRRTAADDRPRVSDRGPRRPGHDREEPPQHLQGDLRRRGLQLVLPGRVLRAADSVHRRAHLVPVERERLRVAGGGQPAADADHLGAARLHRARRRVRVPLRDVQHRRAGPVPRRGDHGRLGRVVAAPAARPSCTSSSRSSPVRSQAPPGPGIAGLLKATRRRPRGDHDDHAQLDRDLGRRLPVRPRWAVAERHAGVRARVERRARRVEAEGLLGRPAPAGAPRRLLPRDLGALVVYWIVLNRTTLGYEVRAVGYNPEAARYGGISVARNYFLAMAISGHVRRARRSDRHRRLAVPGSTRTTCSSRRSGSPESRSRSWGETRQSASRSLRSCSPGSSPVRRRAISIPRSSVPTSRRT